MSVYRYTSGLTRETEWAAIKFPYETEIPYGITVGCLGCDDGATFTEYRGVRYLGDNTLRNGMLCDRQCHCYGEDAE